MRRILFTLLVAGAMLAAVPAASIAVGGDHHRGDRHREREHRHEHHSGRHHDRIRHERFGAIIGGRARPDAGTVASFAGGRLTIRLGDGSSVTGTVGRFPEIECEMRGDRHDVGDGHGRGGPGRHQAGDDRGHDRFGRHDGERGRHRCTTITPGMDVRDATLAVTGFGAVWTRVELIDS